MAQDFWNNTSTAPGPGATTAPQLPTNFQRNLAQQVASNAPTFQGYNDASYGDALKLGYGQAGYGLDQQNAQLGYQSDSRDLALQQGQNGVDQRAAARQPQLLSQLLGLDNQEYDLQRGDAGQAFQKNLKSINSDATARGAYTSGGTNDARKFNYGDLQSQMGHIGIAQDKNTLNASEQKAQAQDRIDTLNMTAGRLGMKGDELKSMLTNQMQKLGLNQIMSVDDLLDSMKNNTLQGQQLFNNLVSTAGQYATNGK